MASLIKSAVRSYLPQGRENMLAQPSRNIHIDLGQREKALLEKDPALSRFKSSKQAVRRIRKVGDVLTVVVVAGFCYEFYVRATK